MKTWTTTYTGRRVDLRNPDPLDMSIVDIARSLANLCRFTGQAAVHYSVAQHSMLVSELCPPHLKMKGLLHDAAEMFTSDIPTPFKACLSPACRAEIKAAEARILDAIGESLGVDLSHDPTVKHFDRVALRKESDLLMPEPVWGYQDLPDDPCPTFEPWPADVAEVAFLSEFHRLKREAAMIEPELVLA